MAPGPAPHILMVSPEAAPYARTGGLGDVLGALPQALSKLGAKVDVVLPAYRRVLQGSVPLRDTGIRFDAAVGERREEASILEAPARDGVTAYFVRADKYFDRTGLYGDAAGDYADNAERFVFFSRAALELLRVVDAQVLHAHDWQAALANVFLRTGPQWYPSLSSVKTMFTIHNAGYQGHFPPGAWPLLNLDWRYYTPTFLEFYDNINLLKGGVLFSDAVTTVSPSYAEEIKTPEQGAGLEGVFRERAASLYGILNGADYKLWDPATDPHLAKGYSLRDLAGKRDCKAQLQRTLGLSERPEAPLIGIVSRLVAQKGFDLLQAAVEELMLRDVQVVVLGNGEARFELFLAMQIKAYPGRFATRLGFNDRLAHQIEAGSDMFLMPSLYEPCGLNQMYSLRYGTVPVVRATGGLRDTVVEYDPKSRAGNGFVFGPYDPDAMLAAIDRALAVYRNKAAWAALMRNGMTADFSWDRSAGEYLALYRKMLGR